MEIAGILVLIISFVVLLLIGVPIAFCIGIATLCTMLVSIPFDPAITTVGPFKPFIKTMYMWQTASEK